MGLTLLYCSENPENQVIEETFEESIDMSEIKMIVRWMREQCNSRYSGGKKNLFWNKENKEKLEMWLK